MGKSIALAVLVGYLSVLTIFSLFSFGAIASVGTEYDDKLHHFAAHTLLTLLAYNYFGKLNTGRTLLYSIVLSILYGIIIEVIQLTIATSRTFDLFDILANLCGALFATFLLKTKDYLKRN